MHNDDADVTPIYKAVPTSSSSAQKGNFLLEQNSLAADQRISFYVFLHFPCAVYAGGTVAGYILAAEDKMGFKCNSLEIESV